MSRTYKCQDDFLYCKFIVDFYPAKGFACDKGTSWVRSIKKKSLKCNYFEPRDKNENP